MKAHPNYKWHSSEKQQGTSTKLVAKPTNSRVIKNVAEISADGAIIPGKLAGELSIYGMWVCCILILAALSCSTCFVAHDEYV